MIKKAVFISISIILLASCSKDEGPFYTTLSDTSSISFKKNVQPIFNSYCTRCHTTSHKKLILLESYSYKQLLTDGARAPYVDTKNPESSIIWQYLNGKPTIMPPSGSIPDYEKQVILNWIKQGAKNN